VSMYFNNDVTLPDLTGGPDIHVARGTLLGQLTLAGHGVGFNQVEVEAFQAEFENEMTNSMPVNPAPVRSVVIQDFSPDYNAMPPSLLASHFAADGSLNFTVTEVPANVTNYVQVRTNLTLGRWQTIATVVPSTNRFGFSDPAAGSGGQR